MQIHIIQFMGKFMGSLWKIDLFNELTENLSSSVITLKVDINFAKNQAENTAEFFCLIFSSVPLTHWPSASQTSFLREEVMSFLSLFRQGTEVQKDQPTESLQKCVLWFLRVPCLNAHTTLNMFLLGLLLSLCK